MGGMLDAICASLLEKDMQAYDYWFMALTIIAAGGVAWMSIEVKRWIEDIYIGYRLKRNYSKLYSFISKE